MTQTRRSSRRKRGKTALALGAAGVSLAMTGAASAAIPTTDVPSQDNARRFILAEEEISDVSLATFQVFDRENPPLSEGIKVARGGGGCGCGHGGGGGGCAHGGGGGAGFAGRCAGAGLAVARVLAVALSVAVPLAAVVLPVAVPLAAAAPVEAAALALEYS